LFHDLSSGEILNDTEAYLSHNADVDLADNPTIFSRADQLEEMRDSDGKFTFRIAYPSEGGKGNVWKTSLNPFVYDDFSYWSHSHMISLDYPYSGTYSYKEPNVREESRSCLVVKPLGNAKLESATASSFLKAATAPGNVLVNDNNMYHARHQNQYEWLQVKMIERFSVVRIVAHRRSDCSVCMNRYNNMQAYVGKECIMAHDSSSNCI